MKNFDPGFFENQYNEIHKLIDEVIKSDFITDKSFEKIKMQISKFDEFFASHTQEISQNSHCNHLKNKIDAIFEILNKLHPKTDNASCLGQNKIVGDYFSDDNSFLLSDEAKSALSDILKK